jgi:putative spermidine/putrescine transport system substrate-binding protein
MYNTKKVKTPPTSWSDLWANSDYKGHVLLWDYLWAYNGVAVAAKLNGGSEDNVQPGMQLYAQAAKNHQFTAFVTSTDQMLNLMNQGNAWLTAWFKGNQSVWAQQGQPVGFAVPKEGVIAFPLSITVDKGSTPDQQKAAADIINLLLSVKYQQVYAEGTFTAPSNSKVPLPSNMLSDPDYSQSVLKNAIQLDWGKIAQHNSEWRALWDRDVKANL